MNSSYYWSPGYEAISLGRVRLVILVGVDSNLRLHHTSFFNRDITMNNDHLLSKRTSFGDMTFENLWSSKSRTRILHR